MAKKDGKEFLKELGTRETSDVTSKVSSAKSGIVSRAVRLVPQRIQWMLPWLQEYIQESEQVSQAKDKVKQKILGKDSYEILPDEENSLQKKSAYPMGIKPLYQKYSCRSGNPLACKFPQQVVEEQPEAKYCSQCSFPATLASETKIRGNKGIYQIENLLGYRGMGRLYQAFQLPDRQPVIIKEYLIPKLYFNQQETASRQSVFVRLAGMALADGRVQDIRLIIPTEAIAGIGEERCFLVTKNSCDTSPSLATYLVQNGAMTSSQVRRLLNQVLQSLEFLHKQKFLLPSGLVQQGLTHGNLTLDTLLFVPTFQGFFIYLCDLALWEHRFNPIEYQSLTYSAKQDLKDLGYIAYYALAGGTVDPVTNQPLNPRLEKDWPPVSIALKNFILNLMGIGIVPFDSAEIAQQVLLRLPPEPLIEPRNKTSLQPEEEKPVKRSRLPLFLLLGAFGLLLLGLLIWFSMRRNNQLNPVSKEPLSCCIDQVSGIPAGSFTYTAQRNSIWNYVLRQENLIDNRKTLETELQNRQPKLKLTYQPLDSFQDAINSVRTEQSNFAITSLANNLSADLASKKFAHDALVVFVAFSYSRRENSLPQKLNGQITFEQLRQLYTGEITNWEQLGGTDLEVKLYIPAEEEAIEIFKQRVLKDEKSLDSFQRLITQDKQRNSSLTINQLQTFATLREVIRDFEGRRKGDKPFGSIAFGSMTQVFGQCSVYPLALVDDNNLAVSPLIHNDENPVTPKTDLCNDKGSYRPNIKAFISQSYPLAYSLAVVYPRDNRREPVGEKFADILRTVEAQRLLSKTGLVPLQPIR
ncbi:MAG: substrate-binding domain-containing protein [Potamolinea sp.]